MDIIDVREDSNKEMVPVCHLKDVIVIKDSNSGFCFFDDTKPKGYYLYNINNKKIKKIATKDSKIVFDFYHQKDVEGEDAYYFISRKKQLWLNYYYLNVIDLQNGKAVELFEFYEDKRLDEIFAEVLNKEYIIVFFKETYVPSYEEFENCSYTKEKYGFERAILFNIGTGEKFEIKDEGFLRGVRFEFFITTIKDEKCVVVEENYMEPYDKEQIYLDIHMCRKSDKNRYYYRDSLKYIPLEQFISEIKSEKQKLSFIDIESRGIEGYEMFAGTDESNIYYEINNFGVKDSDKIVVFNRKTLDKETINLPCEIDEDSDVIRSKCEWLLEDKNKSILWEKHTKDNIIELQEILHGNIQYTYSCDYGFADKLVDEHYLITKSDLGENTTYIIDINNNKIKKIKGKHKMFDDYLVLF